MTDEDTNLGNLLLRVLLIDGEQLRAAVDAQRDRPNARLGELLVEMRVLDREHVDTVLEIQRGLRQPTGSTEQAKAATRLAKLLLERDETARRAAAR